MSRKPLFGKKLTNNECGQRHREKLRALAAPDIPSCLREIKRLKKRIDELETEAAITSTCMQIYKKIAEQTRSGSAAEASDPFNSPGLDDSKRRNDLHNKLAALQAFSKKPKDD